MLYLENPRDSRHSLWEFTSKLNKVARHKTGIQKLAEFLYGNNQIPGEEMKNTPVHSSIRNSKNT